MNFLKKFFSGEDEEDVEEVTETSSVQSDQFQSVQPRTDKSKPEFLLVKPTSRDDLAGIADSLISGKTIVLNLEMITKDTRRFVDFLSGVAYALKGQIKKIADSTFLIIPGGVNISGDIFDDFEEESY